MKLLIYSPYYPPHTGGLEIYTQELAQKLSKCNIEIKIFTTKFPDNLPTREKISNNLEIIRFPAFEFVNNFPLPKIWRIDFWKLFSNVLKEDFDIIISQTRFFSTSLLALFHNKKKKKPWVHIEHGSDYVKSGSFLIILLARIYDATIGRIVLSKADYICTVSNSVGKFIQKILPQKEYSVIYRGFDIESINKIPTSSKFKNKHKDKILIIFVGRLFNGKGVLDLLEAFSKIENNNIICAIIGSGPQKSILENKAKELKIQDKVFFLGQKSKEETIQILKESDILVNPSYTEGLPTSVIEAALCKKAIVATNVGGTSEIIKNNFNGFLIEPRDIEKLKEKLEILINDSQQRFNFGKLAYEECCKKFDWNKNLKEYITFFNKILKK